MNKNTIKKLLLLLLITLLLCSCAPVPTVSQGQSSPKDTLTTEPPATTKDETLEGLHIHTTKNANYYFFKDSSFEPFTSKELDTRKFLYEDLFAKAKNTQQLQAFDSYLSQIGQIVSLDLSAPLPAFDTLEEFDALTVNGYHYEVYSDDILWNIVITPGEELIALGEELGAEAIGDSLLEHSQETGKENYISLGNLRYFYSSAGTLDFIGLQKDNLLVYLYAYYPGYESIYNNYSPCYDPSGEGFFTRLLDPQRAKSAADWFLSGKDYPWEHTMTMEDRKEYDSWLASTELPKDFLSAEHLKNEGNFLRFYLYQWDEERKYYGYLLEKDGVELLWYVDHGAYSEWNLTSPSLMQEMDQAGPYPNGIVPEYGLRSFKLRPADYAHLHPLNGINGFAGYQDGSLDNWASFYNGDSKWPFIGNLTALVFTPSDSLSHYPVYGVFSSELWRYRLNDPSEDSFLSRFLEGENLTPQQIMEHFGLS